MRAITYVAGAAACCLLLVGCTSMEALEAIAQMEAEGKITPEAALEMRELVGGGYAWVDTAITVVGGAALAWLGIRLPPGVLPGVSRGKSTQRHGLPLSVQPAAPVKVSTPRKK